MFLEVWARWAECVPDQVRDATAGRRLLQALTKPTKDSDHQRNRVPPTAWGTRPAVTGAANRVGVEDVILNFQRVDDGN